MIRTLWLIPISFAVVGAGLVLRARHRRQPAAFPLERHEEQEW